MAAKPQRSETARTLDAHTQTVEQALLHRADELEEMARRQRVETGDDTIYRVISFSLAVQYRELAKELRHW